MKKLRGSLNNSRKPNDPGDLPDPSRRFAFMLGCAALGSGALGWRLFDWHVQQSADLTARGASAVLARSEIKPRRGTILDRSGDVMAISRGAKGVIADPSEIHRDSNPFVIADRLSRILSDTSASIAERLSNPQAQYAVVDRGLVGKPVEVLQKKIDDGQLPGIRLEEDRIRIYPNNELAAHALGFVGESAAQPGDVVGLAGIEAWYDDLLRGQPGLVQEYVDALGRRIPIGKYSMQPAQHGATITLAIDRTIQYIVEQELDAALDKFAAESGSIVVTNPQSGEILGLANRPTFNPALMHQYGAVGPEFQDRACSLIYDPGSTFKLITMAAGLDTGAVQPDSVHNLPGTVEYHGQEFKNWDERTYPNQTMTSVLQHSSNTGAIHIADTIGAKSFYEYVDRFGFGALTGIDLRGEVAGIVRRRGDPGWFLPDLASNSFGQGISVTPVQMAAAIGAIANNGVLMRPHVARSITYPNGRQHLFEPHAVRRVISSDSAQTLIRMMETAENGVIGNRALIEGYRTAGKTGTAEIAAGGRILEDTSIASYAGFGPLEHPKVLALVIIHKPQKAFFGAEVASPTFAQVMRKVFAYQKIPKRS